jgi:thioredoxin reductase (NADPH)
MFDIVIIGAGPAGASAGIFAAKSDKKTLIIDSDKSMTKRAWIENHYGVSEISGPELIETGIKQAQKLGSELVKDAVVDIKKTESGFDIQTEEHGAYSAKHVLIATGAVVALGEKVGLTTTDGTEPRIKTIFQVDKDGKTNIDGIWAAGTCAGVSVHTIITAGDGAKVAINIISELNGERYVDHDVLK